ncbi:MAG: amidohydrolase [Anaerolineales bacterium]|nr:amidohydrolase [Chloroflexota bacterium]MBL6980000.1 amidohydrolase [Anaerolineales bacterium]
MPDFYAEAKELFEYTRDLRRDFHQHPELGFQEVRTAGIVAKELRSLGLEVSTGIAETGVVAMIEGTKPGPVVLLRFDMDALPIEEETDAEYASQTLGVMHACGHDGHTAIGLTVAKLLHAHQKEIPGSVKLVFQPAEEGLGGAERMVAEGVLQNPRPDVSLSLHLWNAKPLGWIAAAPGPVMAASETFSVRITGKGGHGALPSDAVDPIFAAGQIITALQSIVSRNVDPVETAVVSVTNLHGGSTFNVIPPYVDLQGTIRTFKPEIRELVLRRFHEVVEGTAAALGCETEIVIEDVTLAVDNDPKVTKMVQAVAERMFPDVPLITEYQTMGSEDMSFMMDVIPGCYFMIGSANTEKGLDAKHHHPKFDFDEDVLPQAAALMAAAAVEVLMGQ